VLTPTHIIGPGGAGPDERLQLAEHIIGAIDKGIAVLANDTTIRWANESFRVWCKEDPVGKRFLDALHFPETNLSHDAFAAVFSGSPSSFRLPQEHLILDVTLIPRRDGAAVTELIAFCDDVTSAVKRQQKLNALYKAGQELENLDPDALTDMNFDCRVELLKQNIHKYIHNLLHYDVIEIRLYEPKTQRLVPLMEEGMLPEAAKRELYALPEGNGVTGYVAATKTAYLCSDASNDPRFLQGSAGVKSSMTVPIMFHEELIGTFNVESPRPNAFGEEDLQFTELFARELGRTLHTLNLLNQQELRTASSVIDNINRDIALPTDNLIAAASSLLNQLNDLPESSAQAQRILNDTRKLKTAIQRIQGIVLQHEPLSEF
jgi:GAF domain-containing protein